MSRQRIVLEGEFEAGWGDDEEATPIVVLGNRTGMDPLDNWIVGAMEWTKGRCLDGQWVRITIEAIDRPED